MAVRKEDIESLGFVVIATTTWADGISFEAHRSVGSRILVKGEKRVSADEAYESLFYNCLRRQNAVQ